MDPQQTEAKQAPIRVLHIITRMIVGGAQENTLLSVVGLDAMPEYDVTLISGIEIWLRSNTQLGLDIGDTGPVYAIEAFCVIVACLLLLLARYRKVASL